MLKRTQYSKPTVASASEKSDFSDDYPAQLEMPNSELLCKQVLENDKTICFRIIAIKIDPDEFATLHRRG